MPIIAPLPVLSRPPAEPDQFVDSRTLALASIDGVNILPFTGDEFIAMWGLQGLDLVARDIALSRIPGMDGARIDDVNIGERNIFVPIWFGSDSGHLPYLDKRDGLRTLFDHRGIDLRADEGSFDLVANSRDGDQERRLRCLYQSGMDGNWERDSSGTYWESVGLRAVCVRSNWYGKRWTTPIIRPPVPVAFFGTFPPPGLSSSRVLGQNIPVTVTGQLPSYPDIELVGPATSVLITAPGLNVSIPAGLSTGELARIVTGPRGRGAWFGGTKNWARVGASTRWAPLNPGRQTINVVMPGSSSNSTSAVISGDSLYEGPW